MVHLQEKTAGVSYPGGLCGSFFFGCFFRRVLRFIRRQRLLDESDDELLLTDFSAALLFGGDEVFQPLVQFLGDLECECLGCCHSSFPSFEVFFEYHFYIFTQGIQLKLFFLCDDLGVQVRGDHRAEVFLRFHGVRSFLRFRKPSIL